MFFVDCRMPLQAHDQNKLIVGFADGGGEVKAENAEEVLLEHL